MFVYCVCVYMRVRIYGPSKRFCDHCQQVSLLLLLLFACMCACSMHDERNIASDRTLARKNVCTHKCMHAFKLKNVKRAKTEKRETGRQTGRQAGMDAGRQADRQADRQAGRQAGRQDDVRVKHEAIALIAPTHLAIIMLTILTRITMTALAQQSPWLILLNKNT